MLTMNIKLQKQNGFSLIELMIAILIGLIVLAATITIYIITIQSSSDTLRSAQLNQDLGIAMTIMTNDIRRAGYWGGAVTGSDAKNNPFNDIQILDGGSCILYTYDGVNADGTLDTNEYYGFKLNNGTIEIKSAGADNTDCAVGTWTDMLGNQVEMTALSFNSNNSKCKNATTGESNTCALITVSTGDDIAEIRQVDIQMAGRVTSDISIQAVINNSVRVRNNRLYTEP